MEDIIKEKEIMLVEVTYACKMGCTHCLSDCKPDGEHMTLEVFEDVLKFMIKIRFQRGVFQVEKCLNIQIF